MAEQDLFRDAVYEIVALIPSGRATSYGAIAAAAGCPHMPRMVGRLMSLSARFSDDLPAHRVVNSQGVLSGRGAFGPGDEMKDLLEAEGVAVENNRIKNWKTVFWNPLNEL